MRLAAALIYAKDLPALAEFYEHALGLKPIEASRTDTWVEFETGAARLGLHAIPPYIAEQIELTSPPAVREETPIKLRFAVDDLAAECQRLDALGVMLRRTPWACNGVDPEGNVFEIFQA